MRLTSEHWEAVGMRAYGLTYVTIALEQGCSTEVARPRVEQVSRVLALHVNAQTGENRAEENSD